MKNQTDQFLDGELPYNVKIGEGTFISGANAFKRFKNNIDNNALQIGENSTLDGVQFAVGKSGRIEIGSYCYLTNVVLLCELSIVIGNFVLIGWNTTISDTDFHPIDPVERIEDAIACSPLGGGRPRPDFGRKPVTIGDDVAIGPAVTILKGVSIGSGAFIEAGSLITSDVAARTRVMGNPARVIGEV